MVHGRPRWRGTRVALLAEGVDRNLRILQFCMKILQVALLAEGVDRNLRILQFCMKILQVALLAEGVDRNLQNAGGHDLGLCRPPRGGRG